MAPILCSETCVFEEFSKNGLFMFKGHYNEKLKYDYFVLKTITNFNPVKTCFKCNSLLNLLKDKIFFLKSKTKCLLMCFLFRIIFDTSGF